MSASSGRRALREAVATLHEAGIDTATNDAEWLFADAFGVGRAELHLMLDDEPLPASTAAGVAAAVRRRARGEPLQHILGWESFRGLRRRGGREVLVPRPESEFLVEAALALLPPSGGPPVDVVDVGTGSGNIACAIASERPDARVLALDVSSAAIALARDNAASLGLGGRVTIVRGDLVGTVRARSMDLVVSNPPYLPRAVLKTLPREVRDHDPRVALDGGAHGLEVIARLVDDARRVLRSGGALIMETGGGDHTRTVAEQITAAGYVDVDVRADLLGVRRFVSGRWGRPAS